jgi:hypothetical protein
VIWSRGVAELPAFSCFDLIQVREGNHSTKPTRLFHSSTSIPQPITFWSNVSSTGHRMRPWLSSFHLSPEARQAIRGPTFAYIECVLFWPFSKIFPDIYWDRYDPRDGYVRTKRVPKSLRKRRRGRRVSMEKLDVPSLSPLLGLPREIRDVIWEYVVGNMQVHWYTEDRRLTGNRCWSEETHCQQECLSWADRPIYPPLKSGIVKAISRPKFGVMGALMSCRQM